ncbi:hypothetical protein B9Z55_027903 [Caenorhabditis nigoni]|uniref:Uncharacterized protein n=1 Tax=Caenorhabditis nigoni TaxID=1611254 RepID=A0A2G5SDV6_9PELO|nr:hypothetical protein B9Z55_027903 [Caenorhabditis nigoni]
MLVYMSHLAKARSQALIINTSVCKENDLKEFHPYSWQNLRSENGQARRPLLGPRPRQGALERVKVT